jgi:hypothetical protein
MKIYIDESGGFSWGKEQDFSLFCGVTIADRDSDELFSRFAEWRRTIAGDSKREIKGSELSDAQLETFADHLLHTRGRDILLTVVGLDTTRTKREHIEELRRQAWVMTERCAEIAAEHDNAWLAEFYRQEAGWLKNRSIENLLWMVGLVHTIFHSIQHTVIHYSDPEDDADYQLMNILIDRSFIHREQHINFWREWLRTNLTKSSMPPTLIFTRATVQIRQLVQLDASVQARCFERCSPSDSPHASPSLLTQTAAEDRAVAAQFPLDQASGRNLANAE